MLRHDRKDQIADEGAGECDGDAANLGADTSCAEYREEIKRISHDGIGADVHQFDTLTAANIERRPSPPNDAYNKADQKLLSAVCFS